MKDTSSPSTPGSAATPSSRRRFITRAAAAAVVPVAAALLLDRSRSRTGSRTVPGTAKSVLTLAQFQPLIGTVFTSADQPGVELTLFKATALKFHRPGVAEQFSLGFSAPDGHPFESRIYRLQHPALGSLSLFISPTSMAHPGQQQKGEAVFNRRPQQA